MNLHIAPMNRIYIGMASLTNFIGLSILDTSIPATIVENNPALTNSPINGGAIEEAIKLIISIAGGFISTLILAWLKRKYPTLFTLMGKIGSKRT